MKLSQALSRITGTDSAPAEKTASAAPTPAPASSDAAAENLKQALKEATAPEAAPAKTAAAPASPVADLAKLAADIAGAEHEASTKEAALYGAAVADGFMARLGQYEAAAAKVAAQAPALAPAPITKTASADDSFEKFAAANPEIVREAHDLGYASTKADLQKLAEAAYVKSYNETVEKIHKTASDLFVAGFSDTLKLLQGSAR